MDPLLERQIELKLYKPATETGVQQSKQRQEKCFEKVKTCSSKKKENIQNIKTFEHLSSALNIWQRIFLSGIAVKRNVFSTKVAKTYSPIK